jgi:hypothetical protein
VQANHLENLIDALARNAAKDCANHLQILPTREMQIKRWRFDQGTDAWQYVSVFEGLISPKKLNTATRGGDQPKDHADRGGLPGPIGTQETHNLAASDLQVEAIDGKTCAILFG